MGIIMMMIRLKPSPIFRSFIQVFAGTYSLESWLMSLAGDIWIYRTSPGLIQMFPTIIFEPQTYLTLVYSNTAFRE